MRWILSLACLLALFAGSAYADVVMVHDMHGFVDGPFAGSNWEIWSVGDAEMLAMSLNATAALAAAGTIDQLIKIGLMGGMFFSLIRAAVTQQPMGLSSFLAGFTAIMLLFGPTTRVIVWDGFTADGYVVENVPIGVAVPMSLATMGGKVLTEGFETAYQSVNPSGLKMTTDGYGSSLQILMALRDITFGPADDSGAGNKDDLSRSIRNYISDCAIFDMNSGEADVLQPAEVRRTTDLWATLQRATFVNIDTVIYLNNAPTEGVQKSCAEAYQIIDAYVATGAGAGNYSADSALNKWLTARMGRKVTGDATRDDARESILLASSSLLGLAFDSAEMFMRQQIMFSLWREAQRDFASAHSAAAAATLAAAEQQRTFQWAAEQTMFEKFMRPLMAFLEMFVVAAAPIMAFVMALGPQGLSLGGKYLLMIAWISLWSPVLAICHFYIEFQASKFLGQKLGSLAALTPTGTSEAGDPLRTALTWDGSIEIYNEMGRWIATGGMLAASTPALTLMLVYGGAITATHLAGRLGGGDQINEKANSPDAYQAPAMVQGSAAASHNANHGAYGTNATGLGTQTMSFSDQKQRQIAQRHEAVRAAEAKVADVASKANEEAFQYMENARHNQTAGSSTTGGGSKFMEAGSKVGREVGSKHGLTQEGMRKLEAIAADTAANVFNGGLTTPGGSPVKLGAEHRQALEARLTAAGGELASNAKSIASGLTEAFNNSSGTRSELKEAKKADDDYQQTHGGTKSQGSKAGQSLTAAVSESNQARKAFNDTKSQTGGWGDQRQYDLPALAAMAGSGPVKGAINAAVAQATAGGPDSPQAAAYNAAYGKAFESLKGTNISTNPQGMAAVAQLMALQQTAPETMGPIVDALSGGMVKDADGSSASTPGAAPDTTALAANTPESIANAGLDGAVPLLNGEGAKAVEAGERAKAAGEGAPAAVAAIQKEAGDKVRYGKEVVVQAAAQAEGEVEAAANNAGGLPKPGQLDKEFEAQKQTAPQVKGSANSKETMDRLGNAAEDNGPAVGFKSRSRNNSDKDSTTPLPSDPPG